MIKTKELKNNVVVLLTIILLWPSLAFADLASWYSSNDACGAKTNNHKGCPTASGESLFRLEREGQLFAASNDYPLRTRLQVTNIANGRSVEIIVLDRGNFKKKYNRIIDLGKLAFSKIADTKQGVINVKVEIA